MTISLDYIKEHIPEIIEGVLWVCSIITFIIKTVKVGKTHSLIKMAFKENTDLCKKRDEKIRSDMKILSDETKRFAEEAKKQIIQERIAMKKEMLELKKHFQEKVRMYKECISEIVKNEKSLIAKGVSENIIKRFEEDDLNSSKEIVTEDSSEIKEVQEENVNGDQK